MILRCLLLSLLLCAAAHGEEELSPAPDLALSTTTDPAAVALKEAVRQVGVELHGVKPEGQGTIIQPLDDSDPEMKALIERYYTIVPCRDEYTLVYCQKALDVLRSGGDRLAQYLIRHIEENDRAGFPDQATYVQLLGRTESPIAYDYLRRRMLEAASAVERGFTEEEHKRFRLALMGLGYTRALPVVDDALAMVERFPDDAEIGIQAVNAIDRVQAKHGVQARAQSALRDTQIRAPLVGSPEEESDEIGPGGLRNRIERILAEPGHTR